MPSFQIDDGTRVDSDERVYEGHASENPPGRRRRVEVARNRLAAGRFVRAVLRGLRKGEAWAKRDRDLAGADINDVAALTAAFKGPEGVFVIVPPNFDPSPEFREARAIAATVSSTLDAARPGKVVYLSTIGAQATYSNLLSQHTIIEQSLRKLSLPITFLRPGRLIWQFILEWRRGRRS